MNVSVCLSECLLAQNCLSGKPLSQQQNTGSKMYYRLWSYTKKAIMMNEWIGDGVNDGSQLLIVGLGWGVSLSIRISYTVKMIWKQYNRCNKSATKTTNIRNKNKYDILISSCVSITTTNMIITIIIIHCLHQNHLQEFN